MASPPNITNITPPRVALIDDRTGLISREWYRFFLNLFVKTEDSFASLDDLQVGPQPQDFGAVLATAIQDLALTGDTSASEQVAALSAQVQALQSVNVDLQSQVAQLMTEVQALNSAPVYTPNLRRRSYGSFLDTTTQTAAAINTAYGMTFNTTDLSNGVYIGSPTSRVYVDRGGVYDIQFSAQLDNTSGGSHLIYIWLRVNGTDVPTSASQTRLKGTDGELVAAWNFLYNFNAGDYFELMWSVSDTSVQILAQAAAAPVPAIPSVILTVTDNISAYQD